MPTVNFSVPASVKEDFDAAFAGENKSAIIARLMGEAVEERRRTERRRVAVDALLKIRRRATPVSKRRLRTAREFVRG